MPRHVESAALARTQDESDAKIRGNIEGIIADMRSRRRRDARIVGEMEK
ncbi:MAG: hypothetical protein ACREE2_13045 [Stellaceae bacterium]